MKNKVEEYGIRDLKLKICSVAAAIVIFHREERRWPGTHSRRVTIRNRRMKYLRKDVRAMQLAYGFLRGRPYRSMENTINEHHDNRPNWSLVLLYIRTHSTKYNSSNPDLRSWNQQFAEWVDEAGLGHSGPKSEESLIPNILYEKTPCAEVKMVPMAKS